MLARFFFVIVFFVIFLPSAFSAECLTIFPGESHPLLPHDERFINIPTNLSTENLVDNTELIRGNNFYKGTEVPNGGSITVAADHGSGKPAILYLGEGVSWVNVKLNANGQAKDLIIYVNSAVNISGDDTQINAIIYVNGTLVVTDKAEIRGALAAIANISISTEVQVSYEQSAIANTDFNGMCGNNTIAMCEVIFPGSNPFAAVTPLSTNSEFKPISECNDSQCVVNDVTTVIARTPTIPGGGSDLGELNKTSLSDEDYNFYSGWQSDKTEVVYSSNSGTAVIYIKSSSDVILPDELELNEDGEVANLLLVIESSTKIEIGKESQIKAFMYLVAPEIKINEEVDIEGGITVDTDKLIVEKDSEFDYESDDLEGFNPHGFCQAPAILENNPILDYRFDECSYTGGPDEVIAQTGNYNADSYNVIDPVNDAVINNSLDLRPLNVVRVTPNWLQVPKNAINGLDDFTVAFWVKAPKSDVSGKTRQQVLHALGNSTSDNQLGIYLRNSDQVVIEVQNESETLDSGTTLTNDTWYHLTLTRQDEDVCLFVNGVSKDCVDDVNEGALSITNDDAVVIGQEQDSFGGGFSTAQSFEGNLDEFKIYSSVLSSSEINTIYLNEVAGKNYDGKVRVTPACPTLHHFEINTLDARGITCQADQITIKACADESCSTVHPDEIDVKLFVNDVEKKTVSVSGANGTTTTYSHATVGNAVLKVKSFGHTYQCTNNLADSSCNVSFKDSGFVISNIPMQISGKSSGEGFNSTTLSLRAVEKNTTTGVCDNVFPDDTEVAVKLSYTCAGGDCKDLLSLSNNGKSYNLTDTATSKDLYFSNNSTANFSLKYPHAAKFIINAKKDVEVTDSDDNTEIKDFSVSSNAFVVRPFAFKLDFSSGTNSANAHAQNGSGNPDASQSAFKKAGETFKLTATAVQWRDGQDNSPIDGIPDNFSVINSNLTAGNFSDGPLTIIHSLLLPKASDWEPGLLATKRSNDFVNSVITNEYSYSEVGIIKLSVNLSDGDYLGAGDILGEITNVGRFTPAYFTQTVESNGSLNAYHYGTCNPRTNDWAYAGQTRELSGSAVGAISYTDYLAPIIHVSAYNLDNVITQNYTDTEFMNLPASGITIPLPVADDATPRLFPTVLDEKVFINSSMSAGDDPIATATKGVVSYTFNSLDHFSYEHNKHSKLQPFQAIIPFQVTQVEDTDLVRLYDGSDTSITATEKVLTKGVEVRFGRLLLENSFGPETSNLPVTMFAQHFNGTGFITNEKENCLTPVVGSKVMTGSIGDAGLNLWDYRLVDLDASDTLLPNHTAASVENKSFTAGLYQWLLFSAPGTNKQGSLNVEYQVPPWLQYDWKNDTNFTNNPSAKLTFGIFRGNDRIIYQREIEK